MTKYTLTVVIGVAANAFTVQAASANAAIARLWSWVRHEDRPRCRIVAIRVAR